MVWGIWQGLGLAGERLIADIRGEQDKPLDAADVHIRELARLHSGLSFDTWREDPTSPVPYTPLEVRRLWVGRLVTFHFVCIGWVIFHTGTSARPLGHVLDVLGALFHGWATSPELLNPLVAAVVIGSIASQYVPPLLARQWSAMFSTLSPTAVAIGFAAWIMVVVALGPEGVSEFIYFQF